MALIILKAKSTKRDFLCLHVIFSAMQERENPKEKNELPCKNEKAQGEKNSVRLY